jgi:ATP-dependent Clp protease ATP-binding subunit ClpA
LLFIGPTGVGKTELAKVLAEYIFHSRKRVIRFDMSEFSDISQVMRLTGGIYNNHGLLVDAVRQDPFSVILFDELEKAHPAFYDLLLQILGEGRLTDSRGNVADFCSTIIIMTSNIGAASIKYSVSGFSKQQENTGRVISHFRQEVQKYFRPELFNRLDRIVGFSPLSREAIRKVVDREIGLLKRREGLLYRNIDLNITTAALDKIGSDGYDKSYGARQLQRTIRAELVIPLAKALNKFEHEKPLIVDISVENERFSIKVTEKIIPKNELKPNTANPVLIELINVLTTGRRKLQLVTNSPNVQGLLSRLDIINRTKRKLGDVFYKDHTQVSEFFWLDNLNNKLTELSERINTMEKLALEVYFDVAPMQQIPQSDYTKWETDFMSLKMDILYPGRNLQTLILAIYGSQAGFEQLYGLYNYLCQKRRFKTKTWLVYLTHDTKSRTLFKHKEWDDSEKALTESEKFNLVGIEIEVTGEAVDIYLKPEEGITEFEIEGEKERCKVIVSTSKPDKYKTPENIIRKQAYEGSTQFPIRRTITANSMKDKLYKMEIAELREMPAEIAEYLDARFEEQVLEAVCNGREGK